MPTRCAVAPKAPGSFTTAQRIVALGYGILAHTAFVVGVGVMMCALYLGLRFGVGRWTGWMRWVGNSLLLLQFPVLHSLLLSRRGRGILNRLAPEELAVRLQPTTYVLCASVQILLVFTLWSPPAAVLWEPHGFVKVVHVGCFALSWFLLAKSMWDAHLGVQTGYIGWMSIWRRLPKISWPDLPTTGLFRVCRQPIYFSFMLTLWTGPVWTIDKIYLGGIWTAYCYWGPLLKEARFVRMWGERFVLYKQRVPYWPGGRREASSSFSGNPEKGTAKS